MGVMYVRLWSYNLPLAALGFTDPVSIINTLTPAITDLHVVSTELKWNENLLGNDYAIRLAWSYAGTEGPMAVYGRGVYADLDQIGHLGTSWTGRFSGQAL